MKIKATYRKVLADLMTPVSLFLKLREYYPEILLLESSDYSSKEDAFSFICFDSITGLYAENNKIFYTGEKTGSQVNTNDPVKAIDNLLNAIEVEQEECISDFNGIFGYTTFDAVKYFEDISLSDKKKDITIPDIRYDFFKFLIVFDHFHEEIYVIENQTSKNPSSIQDILDIIGRQDHHSYRFRLEGEESCSTEAEDFLKMVSEIKEHCRYGNVFQMVPSRRFYQDFSGDDFNVYRALRTINPSPYLFYFDYSDFKIFGSSPEAQVVVRDGIAEIHPIAGTFRRTGDSQTDIKRTEELIKDPKENSEHIMLVDLARNDLSRNCTRVDVSVFRQVQYFSHVIHLVSVVEGRLNEGTSPYKVLADSFPAGTLSGAPKYKALELLDSMEPVSRSFYGGAIGFIGFKGDLNHAIMIRSFLSQSGRLTYQAGAGIVIDSDEESELQEVSNKLAALKAAMLKAESL